jgi:predicted component of type VI protein secretion system
VLPTEGYVMKAELVPENGDPPIPIVKDLTLVGRHSDCDLVIDNPALSKRHCVLVKTDGLLVIRDLATTNGTKVKGQRIRWAALLPDDRISLGGYKLRVYLGSDEIPSPSEQWHAGREAPAGGAEDRQQLEHLDRAAQAKGIARNAAPSAPADLPRSFPAPSPLEVPVMPVPNGHRGGAEPAGGEVRFEMLDDDEEDIIDLE